MSLQFVRRCQFNQAANIVSRVKSLSIQNRIQSDNFDFFLLRSKSPRLDKFSITSRICFALSHTHVDLETIFLLPDKNKFCNNFNQNLLPLHRLVLPLFCKIVFSTMQSSFHVNTNNYILEFSYLIHTELLSLSILIAVLLHKVGLILAFFICCLLSCCF